MVTSSMTPAVSALQVAGQAFTLHRYRHEPGAAFGEEAVQKLGLDADRVFKTLVAEVDGATCIAVVPVSHALDLRQLARASGGRKAQLAAPRTAERRTGYVLGAVSPFGQKTRFPTWLDQSAGRFATVFVSAGRRGVEVEVSPGAFEQMLSATLVNLV